MLETHRDDWRAESQLRLAQSAIFRELRERASEDPAGSEVMSLIDSAVHYAVQRTKLVVRHMKEYTLHDSDHLFRVLMLMERLLPPNTLSKLSVPELQLLILSAFFHDLGMAPSEAEVITWLSYWDEVKREPTEELQSFSRFVMARPDRANEIRQLHSAGRHSEARTLQEYLVADFIRENHSDRARELIASEWTGRIRYRDTDLSVELAAICYSHTENALGLLDLDAALVCGPDIFACLPFVGVILRLADVLDFDAKRTPTVLFSHVGVRHPVSLAEWQKHRAISSWIIGSGRIAFTANCEHPAIEATIRRFCDLIDRELGACGTVLQHMSDPSRSPFPEYYRIPLPARVDTSRIQPKKDVRGNAVYEYRDTQFSLSHSQVIDLLMGTSLYGDPSVVIRELVQNSIDACMLRQVMENNWGNRYEPSLTISFAEVGGREILRVEDNGVGMDQYIIDKYYSKVGSSFYRSADFYKLQAEHLLRYKPISRFGIGILSCFMVADAINVQTRRLLGPHDSSRPLEIRIEGLESIFWILTGSLSQPGTTTELLLRDSHPWKKLMPDSRISAIRSLVPNPPFNIGIDVNGTRTIISANEYTASHIEVWATSSHVRRIDIALNDVSVGIVGAVAIAILEEYGTPVDSKVLFSREVTIQTESTYIDLSTSLHAGVNEISRHSDHLEVDDEDVIKNTSYSSEVQSESDLAVHGIAVPVNLFPSRWDRLRNSVQLKFPFPMKLKIDVIGERDLTLNTARTHIIEDDKWFNFAETLSYLICRGIKEQVEPEYWDALLRCWPENSSNKAPEYFHLGLARAAS